MNTRPTTNQPQRPARPKHEATRGYNTEPSRRSERRSHTPTTPTSPSFPPQRGYNISMSDQNLLTGQFTEATGALDIALISDILAGKDWNLEEAVAMYKETFEPDQVDTNKNVGATSAPTSSVSTAPPPNVWHSPPHLANPPISSTKSPVGGTGPVVPTSTHSIGASTFYSDSPPPARKLLRGLSKVYFERDGEAGITTEKGNVLNAASGPRSSSAASKLTNTNISLDNSYMLPDLTGLSTELADYIEHELIDFVTMNVLERTGHINWWATHSLSRRLWPLHTTGDGNCLLHAASLAMWGIQDRSLQLRKWLHTFLQNQTTSDPLYRRWRWQQTQSNMEMGLILSEEEWQAEWDELLSLSSMSKKIIEDEQESEPDYSYEFLEEFHVYVLAQIIRRPIIVFADSVLRDVDGFPMSPIPFGGIYLPLECKPKECHKSPLMLAYDRSHFTAVVTIAPSKSKKENNSMRDLVPLTGPECDLLPMHFFVDPGRDVDWNSLPEDRCTMMDVISSVQSFIDVKKIPINQIQSGGSLSKSGSSNSVNNSKELEKEKPTVINKVKHKLGVSKSSMSKIREEKEAAAAVELELEPGNELIMCAKLSTNTLKSYRKDVEKYISMTRDEYEKKKSKGTLPDLKNRPRIATKDYALLQVKANQMSCPKSPSAAFSPGSGASSMCRQCEQYLGTPDQDNLCSSCYKQSDFCQEESSELCKKCHDFRGTKEHFNYCSNCYNEFILLEKSGEREQANNNNAQGARTPGFTEYAIEMPRDSGNYSEHQMRSSHSNSISGAQASHNHHYAFPTTARDMGTGYLVVQGNPELTHMYDRDPPAGYLQRNPVAFRTVGTNEPFVYNAGGSGGEALSLGMDGAQHIQTRGLHRVTENRRMPQASRHTYTPDYQGDNRRRTRANPGYSQTYAPSNSRYDYGHNRGIDMPIHHHQSSAGQRPRSRGSISGGTKGCQSCNRLMPVNDQGLCRYCRSSAPQTQYKTLRSQHLATCKRHGCQRPVASNVGFCSDCEANDNRYKKTNRSSTNDKYSFY